MLTLFVVVMVAKISEQAEDIRRGKGLVLLLKELEQASKARKQPLQMTPLVDLYKTCDYRLFINLARDYFWFD